MQNVCLVFIFNHRYEQNIDKLKSIYKDRFSMIRFIVPFYSGEYNEDIIPVYESSYYFEGFFIQAFNRLMMLDVSDYLFVADDLLLNPCINEDNFRSFFGINGLKKCYINEINMLNSYGGIGWQHSMYSSLPFFSKGILWQRELPAYDDAMKRFEKFFGVQYKEKYDEEFFYTKSGMENINSLISTFYENNEHSFDIPYPMAKGYSDVLIMKKDDLSKFARLCGIFSAMDVFVEIAVPTSIVLLFEREEVSCLADTEYTARLLWFDFEYFRNVPDSYRYQISHLFDDWNKEWIYMHPIKLSEWDV